MYCSKSKLYLIGLFWSAVGLPSMPVVAGDLYVDGSVSSSGAGTSWTTALKTLQEALLNANLGDGDTVFVAQGTHYPGSTVTDSFLIDHGVTIEGGYAGNTETDPDARDVDLYETILSGDIDNGSDLDDYGDAFPAPGTAPDFESMDGNAYHVVEITADNVRLDGLTISGGNAAISGDDADGAAIWAAGNGSGNGVAGLVVYNCTIKHNRAKDDGGAAFFGPASGTVEFRNCTIRENSAWIVAGGSPNGGAIQHNDVSLLLVNCEFIENWAVSSGGVINFVETNDDGDTLEAWNCRFDSNLAGATGGALRISDVDSDAADDCKLVNCEFTRNESDKGGAIIAGQQVDLAVFNCTIAANICNDSVNDYAGGVQIDFAADATFISTIFWDNEDDDTGDDLVEDQYNGPTSPPAADFFVFYCDVLGWGSATPDLDGNFEDDPLFVSEFGDVRLSTTSPCVDRGSPDALDVEDDDEDVDEDLNFGEKAPDRDLNARVQDGDGTGCLIVDVGAFEVAGVASCPADLDADGEVGAADLAILLAAWGSCSSCTADFDDDGDVDAADLATLLADWGCNTSTVSGVCQTLEDALDDVGLTLDDWDDFEDAIGTNDEECYLCWMLHYLEDCEPFCTSGCTMCTDPYGGH